MIRRTILSIVAVVCAFAGATAIAPAAGAAAPPDAVSPAAVSPDAHVDAMLVGGDPLVTGSGRCAIGFNARTSTGARVVITSSPCYGGAAGPVPAPAGSTSTPYVRGGPTGLLTVAPLMSRAPVGSRVCMSGPIGGYRCGTVLAMNQTVNFGNGMIVSGLTRTSICAYAGESGAPFVWITSSGVIAQGVLVGGVSQCGSGATSFFMPIAEILSRYRLQLYTG